MALPVQNINHSAFRSMFEKEKLSGNNFNDWFARLKLVLRVEKKMHVIEQPLPPAPEAGAEPNIVAQWDSLLFDVILKWCLLLRSMTPELHRQFELHYPYDMVQELRSMFEKQAGVEKFDLIQSFHACKQEEGKSVADYVLKMKGYVGTGNVLVLCYHRISLVGLIYGPTKDFVGIPSAKGAPAKDGCLPPNVREVGMEKGIVCVSCCGAEEKEAGWLCQFSGYVRSMMNLTTLPLSFWDYALESATRILNMVPTKKVDKTPYELWYGKVPNLSYLKVWGCEALVKRDTPDKLEQRSY
ncbi:zinc finger, CCHC-type containing protein [Tanacetum coccineum]